MPEALALTEAAAEVPLFPGRRTACSEKMLYFEERAARWDSDHACPEEDRTIPLIIPFLRLDQGDRVLDLGCGTGKLVQWLREGVGPSGLVVEVDYCRGMLEAGRLKRFGRRVRFVRMDAQAPAVARGAFDRIICFSLFPHLEDQAGALRGFHKLLRPGGPLVIAHTMGREDLNAFLRGVGGPIGGDTLPDEREMTSLLSAAGFRNVEIADRPRHYIARAWA